VYRCFEKSGLKNFLNFFGGIQGFCIYNRHRCDLERNYGNMTEKENGNIDELIGKVLSSNATAEEEQALQLWMEQSDDNLRYFNDAKRIWNADQDIFLKINIEQDRDSVKDKIIKKLTSGHLTLVQKLMRVAAVLFIPMLFALGWLMLNLPESDEYANEIRIISNKDNVSECILADGTEVWLNKDSELKLISSLKGETREVSLIGEAYFKVARNPQKPFIVHTDHLAVRVLGTSFNVKAFKDSKYVETTLDEGKVSISTGPGKNLTGYILLPGQQAVFNKSNNNVTIRNVDTGIYSSWRNGKYIFKDETLQNIVKNIERYYGVKIRFSNDSLKKLHFRGMIETNKTIFSALENFHKTTNINYKIGNKEIVLFSEDED